MWKPAENEVLADRFRLERELGRGGMGSVWLAHHLSLDIPCAVKFIDDNVDHSEELRSRFQQEARAAAKLRSPNVVQILDHGVWHGTPFIAMELLEGETLAARLEHRGQLSAGETVRLLKDVARALIKAQELGIVHRDIKPENVFIVRDADRDIAKVLDFGVAKVTRQPNMLTSDHRTRTGTVLGTPYYMSPEHSFGVQLPTASVAVQLWQGPSQALSQQTSSTQFPLQHSLPSAQSRPWALRQCPLPSQRSP